MFLVLFRRSLCPMEEVLPMSHFEKVRRQKPEAFLRDVGIRLETFMLLLTKISA